MFKQLFTAITVYFIAFEKLANATNHLSTWAEESAGSFADEARIQRQAKMNAMLKDQRVTEKQLAQVK
jgi:CRISPR/Cas system CMR-associated protein Cmr5 small subunit